MLVVHCCLCLLENKFREIKIGFPAVCLFTDIYQAPGHTVGARYIDEWINKEHDLILFQMTSAQQRWAWLTLNRVEHISEWRNRFALCFAANATPHRILWAEKPTLRNIPSSKLWLLCRDLWNWISTELRFLIWLRFLDSQTRSDSSWFLFLSQGLFFWI